MKDKSLKVPISKPRNPFVEFSHKKTGSGFHEKSKKSLRQQLKRQLMKEFERGDRKIKISYPLFV